jgi:hypothetical protein
MINLITCIHTETLGQQSSFIKNIQKIQVFKKPLSFASSARLSPPQARTYARLFFAQLCINAQL